MIIRKSAKMTSTSINPQMYRGASPFVSI